MSNADGTKVRGDADEAKAIQVTAQTTGLLFSGKLEPGTYWLVEAEAPDGFIKLADPVQIVVAESESDGVLTITAKIGSEAVGGDNLVKLSANKWQLEIQNSAGVELPMTGGPGTLPLTVCGFTLMAVALAFLARRRLME